MKGYITDMVMAQAYAEFNHQVIDRLVLDAIVSCSGQNADIVEVDYFIRPVINMKATSSYDSSVEIDLNEEQD